MGDVRKTRAKDNTEILDLDFRTWWEQKRERQTEREKDRRREGEREWKNEWVNRQPIWKNGRHLRRECCSGPAAQTLPEAMRQSPVSLVPGKSSYNPGAQSDCNLSTPKRFRT